MAARELHTISALRARTGTPAATVHHYLRLGLLPPPRRAAPNRFLYDERHVQRLRLIRALRRRRRLSLDQIRRVLPELLGLGEDQAFRPEMWDRVAGSRLGPSRATGPRDRLLEAAVEAFSRRGYDDVNVDDICRRAGLAKGSFYRHFRSKEEVFVSAAELAADEAASRLAAMGAPLTEEEAARRVARLLRRRLAIFLDLLSRAAQRRPGYRAAARRVLGALAERAGELVAGPGHGRGPVGDRVLRDAISVVAGSLMEEAPAAGSLPGDSAGSG